MNLFPGKIPLGPFLFALEARAVSSRGKAFRAIIPPGPKPDFLAATFLSASLYCTELQKSWALEVRTKINDSSAYTIKLLCKTGKNSVVCLKQPKLKVFIYLSSMVCEQRDSTITHLSDPVEFPLVLRPRQKPLCFWTVQKWNQKCHHQAYLLPPVLVWMCFVALSGWTSRSSLNNLHWLRRV